MEKLIEILEDIQPDADYENCTTLIDDGILESFAILSIVGELEDEFDISITPAESFRKISIPQRLCGQWYSVYRMNRLFVC